MLFDNSFILLDAALARHLAGGWWPALRAGAGEPTPPDCCMFGVLCLGVWVAAGCARRGARVSPIESYRRDV